MLKVNNEDTRTTPGVNFEHIFIVNFEHISHFALVFLLLTLNMYLLTGKISQAVPNFLKHFYFHIKQPIIIYNSHNAYKNADGNSKFKITAWKLTFWKQLVIAKDDIKVSVILANKYEVRAIKFIIPISFYGNWLLVTPRLLPSLFLFPSSSKNFSRHLMN